MCDGRFKEVAWIYYREYPDASALNKEAVSPCCSASYVDDASECAVHDLGLVQNESAMCSCPGGENAD